MDKLIEGVQGMTVKELKVDLKARSITLNANKAVLVERLIKEIKRDELERIHGEDDEDKHVGDGAGGGGLDETQYQDAHEDGDKNDSSVDDDDKNDDDSDSKSSDSDAVTPTTVRKKRSVFTFKDIEESMTRFRGDRKQNLHKWIKDFEATAKIMKWDKLLKFVYAKRLLTGAAKLFINVEKSVTSYKQLKAALKDEFGKTLSSAKVHQELMDTKKIQAETYREYLYRMMAIAEQANVDIESTIQYVIDGIDDTDANKSVLYGVVMLRDIKKRLDAYEIMKAKSKSTSISSKSEKFSSSNKTTDAKPDMNHSTDDKGMERDDVQKVGDQRTSMCVACLKPWTDPNLHGDSSESDEC